MKLLDIIFEKAGYVRQEKAAIPSVVGGHIADPFTIWRTTKKISPERAMEVYMGWVYACIRAIAEELGSIEFRLFKIGKDQDEEQFEHELLDLLEAVNNYQTGFEAKYMIAAHLETVGNAYLFLEGVEDEADKPTAIHILNPARMRVKVNREIFPHVIDHYEYQDYAHTRTFKPYQLIHLKYPDPSDPFEGVGTVQSIAQWIDADNYAMEFNRRFFLNGARLGGFLESESAYTPEQLDYLKKSFEAIFKGVENAYKVAALPKGTKFQAASESQKDMDFSNLMLVMRDRILAGFRVPRTVLGITDDVNRANAEATNYIFALRTIRPKIKLIVSYLNEFLVPKYGDDIYLSFVDPVPENRELEITEMAAATGNSPVLSPNEARQRYFGADPIEGGDAVLAPFNLTPIGIPKPKAANQPMRKQRNGRTKTRFAQNAKRRTDITKSLAETMAKEVAALAEKLAEVKTKNIATLTDDEFEVIWKAFVTRIMPYEKLQAEAVRKLNAKQRKEALANLPKVAKTIDPNELIDAEEGISLLVDLSTPIMTDLMAKEGKEAAALLGITDIDILTPEVRQAIERAMELMSRSYNETTLALLKKKLEEGQAVGLSLDELEGTIKDIFEFSDEIRAQQVARTETFRIANAATHEAWDQSGLVKTVKWYTAADERVCPWCEPLHGKVVGIDDDFFKKGDTVTGSDGSKLDLEYDDVQAPPLHVSCRCYLRPEEISIE